MWLVFLLRVVGVFFWWVLGGLRLGGRGMDVLVVC